MSEHEFQPMSMLSGRCEFCNRPADEHDDPTPEEFADPANWHPIEEHPYLNDPPKVTMPDTLRDRIAAAIAQADGGYEPDGGDLILADAVIAELGIHEDEMGTGATRRTRIVSDWEKPCQ